MKGQKADVKITEVYVGIDNSRHDGLAGDIDHTNIVIDFRRVSGVGDLAAIDYYRGVVKSRAAGSVYHRGALESYLHIGFSIVLCAVARMGG